MFNLLHFQIVPSRFPNGVYILPNKTLPNDLDSTWNPNAFKYFQVIASDFRMKINTDLELLQTDPSFKKKIPGYWN